MPHAHLIVIAAIGIFVGILIGQAFGAGGAAFSATAPFHELQQITTLANSGISVDADGDGIIDNANTAAGIANDSVTSASIVNGTIGKSDVDSAQICTSSGGTGCPAAGGFALTCTPRSGPINGTGSSPACTGNEKLTGGGGDCLTATLMQSIPSGSRWSIVCSTAKSGQTATAICCTLG